jgi:hypothetical protein
MATILEEFYLTLGQVEKFHPGKLCE